MRAWGLLLPLYQAFQWKCLTGPPLDPSGCHWHPASLHSPSLKSRGSGCFPGPDLHPLREEPTVKLGGKVPGLREQGH